MSRITTPILAPDPKYAGKYIAMRSFSDRTIIASGKVHDAVYARANAKGVKMPVMFYVPPKNVINIY